MQMNKQNYQPKNVLITGGAGFIGANFIRYYLKNEPHAKIINLDLLTYAGSLTNLENLPHPERYQFIQGDICNAQLVEKILRQHEIDTIVHFAAESHVDRSIAGPAPFIQTNIVGTFVLLEAARQFWLNEKKWDATQCRFHHISTDEVFGSLTANDPPFNEQSCYSPNSPYSASKASSDHLVRSYFHTYQLPMTISNCSNNYGPYQHTEKLIPTIIHRCFARQPIPVYGDGSHIRDWLYVEDHCMGIHAILARGALGQSYNIGGNTEIDNLSAAKKICAIMDEFYPQQVSYSSLIQFVPDRAGHDWRYAIDIQRMSKELGWKPKTPFANGIRETIKFYHQMQNSMTMNE